ncbi:hypothetical protein GCM10022291_16060 [Postechiella marina]|uniref:Lipoprotein n=2 Tax=Postechiella marina TaxID=943941 RepID=A0ABP8C7H3_9FLAO
MNNMRLKFLIPFCLVCVLLSCKDSKETAPENLEVEAVKLSQIITEADIAKLNYIDFGLDSKAGKIIEDWGEYIQLQQIVLGVKKANFTELKDNRKILKSLLLDFKKNIPASLKSSSILARVMVFETKFFKLESLVNLSNISKLELAGTIKEVFEAFSNLNFQINKKLERDSQNIERPI